MKRCKEDIERWATEAEDSGKPVYGIKSYSILSLYIDIVRDIPIDYMHMILEGISKMLLKYWSDGSFKDRRFYLGKGIDTSRQNVAQNQTTPQLPTLTTIFKGEQYFLESF